MSINVVPNDPPQTDHDLPHDETETGRNCWCCPDLLQTCPDCDVRLTDETRDETADNPLELSIFKEARLLARPHCQRCCGTGMVKAFDPKKPLIILHR